MARPKNTEETFFTKSNYAKLVLLLMRGKVTTEEIKTSGLAKQTWYNLIYKGYLTPFVVEEETREERKPTKKKQARFRPLKLYSINWEKIFERFKKLLDDALEN